MASHIYLLTKTPLRSSLPGITSRGSETVVLNARSEHAMEVTGLLGLVPSRIFRYSCGLIDPHCFLGSPLCNGGASDTERYKLRLTIYSVAGKAGWVERTVCTGGVPGRPKVWTAYSEPSSTGTRNQPSLEELPSLTPSWSSRPWNLPSPSCLQDSLFSPASGCRQT